MDYWAAVRELCLEKLRIDRMIAALEALSKIKESPVSGRGRRNSSRKKAVAASQGGNTGPREPNLH